MPCGLALSHGCGCPLDAEIERLLAELAAEKKSRAAFQVYGMMWEQAERENERLRALCREAAKMLQRVAEAYVPRSYIKRQAELNALIAWLITMGAESPAEQGKAQPEG